MNFLARRVAGSALLGLALTLFAGCGNDAGDGSTTSGISGGGGGGEGKVYVVGTEATFPPFEMTNDAGEIIGFDIDLLKAIAADQNIAVEFKDMGFDGLIPALQSGQIDIIASGMSITDEREQAVDFTDPYINAGLVIAVRANETAVSGPGDLAGKPVAVQIGSTGASTAESLAAEGKVGEVKSFANVGLAMQALIQGEVAAVINDKPVSEVYVAQQPGKVRLLEEVLAADDYGYAVRSGNSELLEKLNAGLASVQSSGKMEDIKALYFVSGE